MLCAHLLGEGVSLAVNHVFGSHGTLLHKACERGSLLAMQLLIWVCPFGCVLKRGTCKVFRHCSWERTQALDERRMGLWWWSWRQP